MWTCECDCGTVRDVVGDTLVRGKSTTCGKRGAHPHKHGDCINGKSTTEYRTWSMMIQRCENKKLPSYLDYGGRGITVCERWHKYENFLADMGRKPSKNHSLDRMNNEKGYSRSNCRWATRKEQVLNKRSNRIVTHEGVAKTLTEWAEDAGLARSVLRQRLESGWDVERSLMQPVQEQVKFILPNLKPMTGKKKVKRRKRTTV